MTYRTPLRYPGGKARISSFIKELIRENSLTGKSYIEPFAGGAGVALELLFSGCVGRIYLNDYNLSIYSFWRAVLEKNDKFCERIAEVPVNIDEWQKQKDIQKSASSAHFFDLGFSTFFLNRTNRSGIILAGVIGGKEQAGKWKMDARYNKENLIKRIKSIGLFSSKISISNEDAKVYLKNIARKQKSNSLLYLDPPYYVKGEGLYEHHFKDADHKELFEEITKKAYPYWMVSYDNEPFIKKLYDGYNEIVYSLSYSAASPTTGKEIVFFSKNLVIPNRKILD
ncbi:MAG: DNA adenine methylase [Pusillimonas sp.]